MSLNFSDIDAVVLCGGLGTRLFSVTGGKQKVIVDVYSKPFLVILIEYLFEKGFRRFIFASGHDGKCLEEALNFWSKDAGSDFAKEIEFVFSHEAIPLGTGGALRNALKLINSENFFVFNGDSIALFDYEEMLEFHLVKGSVATISLGTAEQNYEGGFVRADSDGAIEGFSEKKFQSGFTFINAGAYIFNKRFIERIPLNKRVSLEQEIFPKASGRELFGYKISGDFYDIGTPERLERFRKEWKRIIAS